MTIRPQSTAWRSVEYLFLLVGLLAVDYYLYLGEYCCFASPSLRSLGVCRKPLAMVGTIEIPRLHLNLVVREGVNEEALRRAVGHIPSSALPGQFGNVAFAAHRDTFFRPLRDIKRGGVISVQTLNGVYRYQVESIRIVSPQGTWVLNASNRPELTPVTCYPFNYVGSAPKRFIVRATQIAGSAHSTVAPRSG